MTPEADRAMVNFLYVLDQAGELTEHLARLSDDEKAGVQAAVARDGFRARRDVLRSWEALPPRAKAVFDSPAHFTWLDTDLTEIEDHANGRDGG